MLPLVCLYLPTFWCWPNAIQFGFVIPWNRIIWKFAIAHIHILCIHIYRFYFQISIWFLFAYYNVGRPVHSFICIAIYLRSFIFYTFFLSFTLQYFPCVPQLLPHFCALDRQAEIHFICHTINIIIGNLQKRFLFLMHSRNWIYFFIYLFFFALVFAALTLAHSLYNMRGFGLFCSLYLFLCLSLSSMQAKSHETHFTSENE